jgi:hypothetical protein
VTARFVLALNCLTKHNSFISKLEQQKKADTVCAWLWILSIYMTDNKKEQPEQHTPPIVGQLKRKSPRATHPNQAQKRGTLCNVEEYAVKRKYNSINPVFAFSR